VQNPLLTKQAIIVLREELEYFSIPPKDSPATTDKHGIANEGLVQIKRRSGDYLMDKRNIFTALQRNVNKENNMAEQHLIDMLCMRYGMIRYLSRGGRVSWTFLADSTGKTNGVFERWNLRGVAFRQSLSCYSRPALSITRTTANR
jgi:hypothetical protein